MVQNELAPDYLRHCRVWQKTINSQTTAEGRREFLDMAFDELKGLTFHGTRKVIVHGEGVLHIPDGTSGIEESIWPWMQFKKVETKGWLGRLYAIVQPDEITLTWPIYEARVLGPIQDEEVTLGVNDSEELFPLEIEKRLSRPLHFPVGLIDFAMCYAE